MNDIAPELGLTIVVPAWHGERTLHRCLDGLLLQSDRGGGAPRHVQVIVAVNDARAATREVAIRYSLRMRRKGYSYTVVETPPGRSAAFNYAERCAEFGARLYLDQDAKLSSGALEALMAVVCRMNSDVFATFAPRFTCSGSPYVRAFLRGWSGMTYFRKAPVTVGAYAVSAAGRSRWDGFPAIASDDKFVRLAFTPPERVVLDKESYEVVAPVSVRALVRDRLRYLRYNRELRAYSGDKMCNDWPRRYAGLFRLLRRPATSFDIGVVIAVTLAVHLMAALRRA